jgi:SAM-dependent methyltransferase
MSHPEVDPRMAIQAELAGASNYNAWIAHQARAHIGQRVLDAGCGSGNVTSLLLDRECVVAVDVWEEFVALMRECFAGEPNLAVHRFDLSDPAMVEAMKAHRVDSAVCLNVLEHVKDDRAALANLAAGLPSNAPVFLLVPAFMLLYGEHDRADHHFRRYTKRSLRRTLEGLPLRLELHYYMNMPGFFAWLLVSRVLRRQLGPEGIGYYDRLIPAIRLVEEKVRPPFGQSLVAVLRTTG